VAAPESVSVYHSQPTIIVLGGSDAETLGSQLTYTITVAPAHGTLTPITGSPGAYTYTSNAGYVGADSFSYTVTDNGNPPGTVANEKTSAPATVAISVIDPPPVGVAVTYTTRALVPLNVPASQGVLAADLDAAGDTLTATLDTTTKHGTLVLKPNGSFTYTPNVGFTGTDTFTYTPVGAIPSAATGATVTVTITVTPSASAPAPGPTMAISASGDDPDAAAGDQPLAPQAATPLLPAPDADADAAAWPVDALTEAMDLLAIPDPILLPAFTLPGDQVAALMLPAVPEMAHLEDAVSKAVKRLTQRTPSHITFVDPVTGHAHSDHPAHAVRRAAEQSWRLIDTNETAKPSRITWETA
jgi:VCBS repeat-containing protein